MLCADVCIYMSAYSIRVAPAASSSGYLGSAGLSDHSPVSPQEEKAERQPDQPEDSERKPESGQRNRH